MGLSPRPRFKHTPVLVVNSKGFAAMANATVLNIGQVNGAGLTDAMFLKVWGGEVLTAFQESNVVMDKHIVRQIASGKSASFPATWKVTAGYHVAGTEIVGQTSNVAERVITIDDLLLSSVFIPLIDEAKNHFDYRSIYSGESGNSLAYAWDKNVLQLMVLAARASATVTGAYGGTSLTSATTLYKTSAVDLAAGLYAAAQAFDDKDIPEREVKTAFMKPAQYFLLAQSTALLSRDWNGDAGNGNYKDGKILAIGGLPIQKATHLPTTNINTGVTAYQGDFTKTAAVVTTKGAVGTVKLLDMSVEMAYDIRRQGTLIVSKYAVGHGILRPECAVELKTTT